MRNVEFLIFLIWTFSNLGDFSLAFRITLFNSRGSSSCRWSYLSMGRNDVEAWLEYTTSAQDAAFLPNYVVDCVLESDMCSSVIDSISDKLPQSRFLYNRDEKLFDKSGKVVGASLSLDSVIDQNRALSLVGSVEWIVLRCTGTWKMIPVENLIAACDGTATKLAVHVDSAENLPGILFSLQLGPHAVILPPDSVIWSAYSDLQLKKSSQRNDTERKSSQEIIKPRLEEATIVSVLSGGIGDRVCIDLIQLLKLGEGLLIGSSSKFLALVHGETFEGEYVPSRPFRVNAGPVHSYVLMADGSTKYLSELVAGDSVRVVDASKYIAASAVDNFEGNGEEGAPSYDSSMVGRAVTVGRCKIETRPMLMVSYVQKKTDSESNMKGRDDADSNVKKAASPQEYSSGQIFLQQAETVRLIAPTISSRNADGSTSRTVVTVPVTEVKSGDVILTLKNDFGTHVGNRISATVVEK